MEKIPFKDEEREVREDVDLLPIHVHNPHHVGVVSSSSSMGVMASECSARRVCIPFVSMLLFVAFATVLVALSFVVTHGTAPKSRIHHHSHHSHLSSSSTSTSSSAPLLPNPRLPPDTIPTDRGHRERNPQNRPPDKPSATPLHRALSPQYNTAPANPPRPINAPGKNSSTKPPLQPVLPISPSRSASSSSSSSPSILSYLFPYFKTSSSSSSSQNRPAKRAHGIPR